MTKNELILALLNDDDQEQEPEAVFIVGQKYLIRTCTFYYVGRLQQITPNELVLSDASWVADTGRFHQALTNGLLEEVEPFVNPVIINRGALVDATVWNGDLPKEQK